MKKWISFLLATVLLFSLVGCKQEPVETQPSTTATGPKPASFLELSAERKALIEEAWHEKTSFGYQDDQVFCSLNSAVDGIRYYGSYEIESSRGTQTIDILYIPCKTLPVASQITLGGHTFRSRMAFGLYVFSSTELESLGFTMNTLYPLADRVETENGISQVPEDVLAAAAALHREYEIWLYGSELAEMPEHDPDEAMMRLQASWLMWMGHVPNFGDSYYGTYSGYDIVFEPTMLAVVTTMEIGGVEFTCGSSFVLYAHKDGQFHMLRDIYNQGLITAEEITQIGQAHRKYNPGWEE